MKNILVTICALLGMCFVFSCSSDSEEDLYPESFCNTDTLTVSFATDIVPVLETSCYACHSLANGPNNGGGIILEGHANVFIYADNGSLFGSINHDADYTAMPLGGAKLEACTIAKVEKWIADGALDN